MDQGRKLIRESGRPAYLFLYFLQGVVYSLLREVLNMRKSIVRGVFITWFLAFSHTTFAQSVTIIGQSEDARECYFSAQIAIQMQSASRSDLETCTRALQTQNLAARDKAATFINRGIIYVALEDYQEAVDDYAVAENLFPEFGAVHVNRGNLFFISEVYDGAIKEYNKALEIGLTQQSVAYLNRGMAYEKLGRLQEAKTDYLQAIELSPEWKQPQYKLERVNKKLN